MTIGSGLSLACDKDAHKVCGGNGCRCECHTRKPVTRERPPHCGDKPSDHVKQPWEKIGRCVYCACGARLYDGELPPNEVGRLAVAHFLEGAANEL